MYLFTHLNNTLLVIYFNNVNVSKRRQCKKLCFTLEVQKCVLNKNFSHASVLDKHGSI